MPDDHALRRGGMRLGATVGHLQLRLLNLRLCLGDGQPQHPRHGLMARKDRRREENQVGRDVPGEHGCNAEPEPCQRAAAVEGDALLVQGCEMPANAHQAVRTSRAA